MLDKRVIPTLLIESGKLVKSTRFKNLKYVGDPINAVKIFNEKFVDEIIIIDITNKKSIKEPNFDLIENIANECFIPLTYGGNIKSLGHAQKLFKLGIEKISVNSMLVENPILVKSLVDNFGSSSIVASIDYKRNFFNKIRVVNKKIKFSHKNLFDWISKVEKLGVGEFFINSIDNDGMFNGMDVDTIKKVVLHSNIPIIFCGGVGSFEHIINSIKCGLPAVGVGSFFIFHGKFRAVLISYLNSNQILEINEN
jgi:cyclase